VLLSIKIVDGEKVYLTTTTTAHVRIAPSTTIANASKITINNGSAVTIKKGNSKKLTAEVVLAADTRQLDHVAEVRFVSTDTTVATVSASGKITAKAKGTCYVYAVAVNGMYDKIKVTVK